MVTNYPKIHVATQYTRVQSKVQNNLYYKN